MLAPAAPEPVADEVRDSPLEGDDLGVDHGLSIVQQGPLGRLAAA